MKPSVKCKIAIRQAETAVELTCTEAGVIRARFCSPKANGNGESHEEEIRAFCGRHAWFRELIEAIERYLAGEAVDFSRYPVDFRDQPPFRARVLEACRRVPYGQTISYAELAAKAGNPRAARAAGSAMSHNPIPILIPCHRVLHSGGGLGGFSAPGGLKFKERLLAMERGATHGCDRQAN